MTNDLIAQARKRYLAAHPLRVTAVPAFTSTGERPAVAMDIPNIGDMGIIGCKLGMEYLAICHDDDAVEEWIRAALAIAKTPELMGILFANVFRGVNVVIGSIISEADAQQQMEKMAVEAWLKDFDDFEDSAS